MKQIIMAFFLGAAICTGCESTDTEETESPVTQTPAPTQVPLSADTTGQPATLTPPPPPAAGARINPPHGQPGHRCDIEVGAPLPNDGKPATSSSSPSLTQPPPQTLNVPPPSIPIGAATPTAPGMNPPHGQAGHRCDIAVGAPLSSAPQKPQ